MTAKTEDLSAINTKIVVDHPSIQKEGVFKLLQLLQKSSSPINASATQLYNLLLTNISNSSIAVAESSLAGLVELVRGQKIELKKAFYDLINCIPSISNPLCISAAIQTVSQLLIEEFSNLKKSKIQKGKSQPQNEEPIYTLTSSVTHPFISILKARNDIWKDILHEIIRTINALAASEELVTKLRTSPEEYLKLVWPFITHCLLDPTEGSLSNKNYHIFLHSSLIRLAHQYSSSRYSLTQDIIYRLVTLIPLYPIANSFEIQFVENSIEEIIEALIEPTKSKQDEQFRTDMGLRLINHLLLFMCELQTAGKNILSSLHTYKKLTLKIPATLLFESAPIVLGYLLLSSTSSEQSILLSILHGIVDALQVIELPVGFTLALPFLILPILLVISSPISDHKSSASSLLKKVELTATASAGDFDTNPEAFSLDTGSGSAIYGILTLILNGQDFVSELFQKAKDEFEQWMAFLSTKLTNKEQATLFTQFFISPFLMHGDPNVRKSTCQLIAKYAEIEPLRALNFLALLLHQLAKEQNPEVQLSILYTFPALARNPACVTPILRVLLPIIETPSMKHIAIRLVGKLWENQDRIFSRIQGLIGEYKPDLPIEERVAIASCIKDICFKRPNRGPEIISILSKIISQDSHPTPVAMGVEALNNLCIEDVVEFKTAWQVISKSIGNDSRPFVQAQLALFLSNAVEDAVSEDDADKAFVESMVTRLWTLSRSNSPIVRKEAFRSLTRFAEANVERLGDVNTLAYVNLLAENDLEARKEVEKLIISLLKFELLQRRRHGDQHINTNNPSLALLGNLPSFLQTSYENATRPSVRSAVAGAVMYSFQPPPIPKEAAKLIQVPRRYLVSKAQAYKRSLIDLLTDMSSRDDRDWNIRLMTIPAIVNFMKETVDSCIQGEIAQASINGEVLDERSAVERVSGSILKLLLSKTSETPKLGENASLAIGCLATSLPSYAYDQIEKLTDILKTSFVKGENEWIKYGSVVGLGLASLAVQSTDTSRLQDLFDLLSKNSTENSSEWVKFGSALSLGILGSGLYRQVASDQQSSNKNESESSDFKRKLLISIVNILKSQLEAASKLPSENKWGVLGASLGIGWASASLELANEKTAISEIYGYFEQIIRGKLDENSESSFILGAILTLPALSGRAFRLEQLSSEKAAELVKLFEALALNKKSVMHGTFCIGYATTVHALLAEGFVVSQEQLGQVSDLLSEVAIKNENANSRIGAIIGVSNLLGAFSVTPSSKAGFSSPMNSSHLSPNILNNVKNFPIVEKIINLLKTSFESDSDQKVCRVAGWLLGSLSRPLPPTTFTSGTPANLSHLPETSLIRALFNILQSSLVTTGAISHQIASTLSCLSQVTRLPPVRWESLLLSLSKSGLGTQVKLQCVRFALSNTNDSAILALLNDWVEPSRFNVFEIEIQHELFKSLPQLLSIFPTARSRKLVTDLVPFVFELKGHEEKRICLQILGDCLAEPNIPQPEIHNLLLEDFINKLETPFDPNSDALNTKSCELLGLLGNCMKFLPKEFVTTKLNLVASTDVHNSTKYAYLIFQLVVLDYFPSNTLQQCRTWCLSQTQESGIRAALQLMPHVFSPLGKIKENSEKLKWLLDSFDTISMCPTPVLGIHLIAILCNLWLPSDSEFLFSQKNLSWIGKISYSIDSEGSQVFSPGSLLPYTLPKLLKMQSFSSATEKIIQRLENILLNPKLKSVVSYVTPILIAERMQPEFIQNPVWNVLVSSLQSNFE